MLDKSASHYVQVSPGQVEVKEQIPPEGVIWELVQFTGCAAYTGHTTVKLVWDYGGESEEILAAVHGDGTFSMVRQVTGDGRMKLALVLENRTDSACLLGGRYEAREL